MQTDKKEAIPEKIQAVAGWGVELKTYFFDENLWNFEVCHLTCKNFWRKQSFTPGKVSKVMLITWNFQRQKPRPWKLHMIFAQSPLEISFLFSLTPGFSTWSFFNNSRNSMSSILPHAPWTFHGSAQSLMQKKIKEKNWLNLIFFNLSRAHSVLRRRNFR